MSDDGFGQDEYRQPYNSMGFVTNDKHAEEKKKKYAKQDKFFEDAERREVNKIGVEWDDDY